MDNWKPIVIQDTREQDSWCFDGICEVEIGGLDTADYSLKGFEDYIRIERKSLGDIVGCIGSGRERFKRELQRLRSFKCKAVFIECDIQDIYNGNWRQYQKYQDQLAKHWEGKANKPKKTICPAQVIGSINSWRNRYDIEFVYAGEPRIAAQEAFKYMTSWVNYAKEFAKRFDKIK